MDAEHMAMKALWSVSLSQNHGRLHHFSEASPEGIAVAALEHAAVDDQTEALNDLAMGEFHKSERKGDSQRDEEEKDQHSVKL